MLFDDVKLALRISHNALDNEIDDLISAARQDLILSGITFEKASDDTDSLIKRAIITYCKANSELDNDKAVRFQNSYDSLKTHLSSSMDYNSFSVTFMVKDGANPLEDAIITFNNEEKYTNSTGKAVFNGIKESQNVSYAVKLTGYVDINETVDIEGSKTIDVTMSVVA